MHVVWRISLWALFVCSACLLAAWISSQNAASSSAPQHEASPGPPTPAGPPAASSDLTASSDVADAFTGFDCRDNIEKWKSVDAEGLSSPIVTAKSLGFTYDLPMRLQGKAASTECSPKSLRLTVKVDGSVTIGRGLVSKTFDGTSGNVDCELKWKEGERAPKISCGGGGDNEIRFDSTKMPVDSVYVDRKTNCIELRGIDASSFAAGKSGRGVSVLRVSKGDLRFCPSP